jgi:hypothetical protein
MKKLIYSLFIVPFIALGFCTNLHAQSSEKDLDQAELLKQFTGKWITETGEDSTAIIEFIPNNKGYRHNSYWQTKGETYRTAIGLLGFTWEKQTVINSALWPNGNLSIDKGKFVSDTKMKWERFNDEHNHVIANFEIYFTTPDEWKMIFRWRGMKETWDDAVVTETIYTRVKK